MQQRPGKVITGPGQAYKVTKKLSGSRNNTGSAPPEVSTSTTPTLCTATKRGQHLPPAMSLQCPLLTKLDDVLTVRRDAQKNSVFAVHYHGGFPGGSEGKASAYNVGDLGSIPGSGRSPREGNGNPLQYSCLESPMDGGSLQATVHGVAKSLTRLSEFTSLHFITCYIDSQWEAAVQHSELRWGLEGALPKAEMTQGVGWG